MEKDILSRLYYSIREKDSTEEYNQLMEIYTEQKRKLTEQIEEDRQKELEEMTETLNRMCELDCKETFCEAFSMAVRLFVECTYKEEDI